MKNVTFILSFLLVFNLSDIYPVDIPASQEVLQNMKLANSYFLNVWPDPTKVIVTDKTRPSNLWTRATYFEGLMQLYYLTNDNKFYQYAVDWGTFHKWQPTYVGTALTRNGDNLCCSQTYIELYNIDPKPERIATIKASIDNMVNTATSNDWWWIDAIHMAMPVFAKMGVLTGDVKYFNKMYDLYCFPRYQVKKGTGLYNSTDKLWYRDSVYLPPKVSPNNLPVYWSRGNGWVMAALVRVLDVLPENAPHRDEYISMFKDMASKLITIQREDGFWNPNLADPNDYGGKETSGTAFFVYGLAWGVNHHLLDSATYYNPALKGWNGMVNDALHPDGSLGYVQSTGSKPSDGQPLSYDKKANFEDYGLGGFLLAGSEIYRMIKSGETYSLLKNPIGKSRLNAFPVCFSDELTVLVNPDHPAVLTMYDVKGCLIFSKKYEKGCGLMQEKICSSDLLLSEGIYFLKLADEGSVSSLKVFYKKGMNQ
jgi:rhamnogalacturonyl hydrolase YesR